ncbi:MAG: beta-phosphoglucomutase [Bacteroidetes bacterium]|jgi:beta-phosphoglucomutase|nr:beta-phosphoglucomutase [Bacteroidota bacterium]
MNTIKALIFDLDGVLVSTEHNHFLAWKRIADTLNIPFNENENELLKGLSREKSLETLLSLDNRQVSASEFEELLRVKNEAYLNSVAHLSPQDCLPGVTELIDAAKKANLKLAVGSASRNAKLILQRIELDSVMDTVVDGHAVKKTKPDPEVFLRAAKNLQLSPAECLVFEDAESGVQAALDGGFMVIGVGNPSLKNKVSRYIPSLHNFNLNEYEILG